MFSCLRIEKVLIPSDVLITIDIYSSFDDRRRIIIIIIITINSHRVLNVLNLSVNNFKRSIHLEIHFIHNVFKTFTR